MSGILFLNDLCKKNNINLPEDIIKYINIYNGEGYREYYILENFIEFWNRYIDRILGKEALDIIINPQINKCLCRFVINNKVKVYHYKSRYIKLFTNYPLDDSYEKNKNEMYLEDFIVKLKIEDNRKYYYISFIVNLNKFIIKNEQRELDKKLQIIFINKLINYFEVISNKIKLEYRINEFFNNKMKLIIEIDYQELTEEDYIRYKELFINNIKNKSLKDLCKSFLKEKIYDNLIINK